MKTNISVRIMENDFQLVCNEKEKIVLERSAAYLNEQILEFKKTNSGIDNEKTVLMGALRTVCNLVTEMDNNQLVNTEANSKLNNILDKL